MILRDYQHRVIDGLRDAYRRGARAPVLVMPTGSGKTCVFSEIARLATGRVWIVVHREELLRQASAKLDAIGVPHGMIAAGREEQPDERVQVASIQTLARRLDRLQAPDLMILDECHHALSTQYRRVLSACPAARVLGVTATPERLDGRGLREVFDSLVLGPSVRDLQDAGHLVLARVFAPAQIDTTGLRQRGGDYAAEEIAERARVVTGDAVREYLRRPGQALAFCCTVAHAEAVAWQFVQSGVRAARIDGGMEREERAEILRAFAAGEIHVVTSCEILGEGFDCPGADMAILLRPTASLSLHLQQIGRALRPAPGKSAAIVHDHSGNTERHGLPDEPRAWSLDGKQARQRAEAVLPEAHRCRNCFSMWAGRSAECPQCGAVREASPREIKQQQGELEELQARERAQTAAQRKRAATYEELVALGRAKGYKHPEWWARKVYEGRRRSA